MSISIITDADIPTITRLGSFIDNISGLQTPVDAGTGMGIAITGNVSDGSDNLVGPPTGPNQYVYGVVTSSYSVGGLIDFDHIVTDIPTEARITKIEIQCDLSYALSSSIVASYTPSVGSGDIDGSASAGIKATIAVANTAFTPTTDSSINDLDSDENGAPAPSMSLSAQVNQAGMILEKIWNIEGDLGQFPLGYITRAILVAQFNNIRITFLKPTPSTLQPFIGASGFNATSGTGVGHRVLAESAVCDITVSNFLMTVHWEEPFSWTLESPTDPIQAGDHVRVESPDIDWGQILTVTLTSPAGDSTVITFSFLLTLFTFTVPVLVGSPPIVHVSITSTQFSGSIDLGPLVTIFFLNATGIYTLVPGKTNDTIYDNDDPGATVDVKIPNPTYKTGFIGG